MKNPFTEHPHDVGETYWKHMFQCWKYACTFFCLVIVIEIHAIFPFLFVNTASNIINKLHFNMSSRVNKSSYTHRQPGSS